MVRTRRPVSRGQDMTRNPLSKLTTSQATHYYRRRGLSRIIKLANNVRISRKTYRQ